jgi:AraC-like DNA-binding protein
MQLSEKQSNNRDISFRVNKTQHIADVFSGGAEYQTVPTFLEPIVESIVHLSVDHPQIDQFITCTIPHGKIVLYFNFRSPVELFDANMENPRILNHFISGAHNLDQTTLAKLMGPAEMLIVTFKPGWFANLFVYDPQLIVNKEIKLDEVMTSEAYEHVTRIEKAVKLKERLSKLYNLFTYLMSKDGHFPVCKMSEVTELIHRRKGNISLNEISSKIRTTSRTIERWFKQSIGICPKEYIRNTRFNQVFFYLFENSFTDWQQVLHHFGYYDQSHFIHDFKTITGHTPNEFFNFKDHGIMFLDRFHIIYRNHKKAILKRS